MKKLIIIAVSAAMTFAASAASATWGFGSDSILDRNGDYLGDSIQGTAFLYLGTAVTTESTIDLAGLVLLATAGQDATTYQFGSIETPVDFSGLSSDAAGQAYTLLLVEGNGLSELTQGNTYQMIVATGTSGHGTDPMSGATWATFVDTNAYTATSWANLQVVPEPTSGLLMLLGMAGLALRRKQK